MKKSEVKFTIGLDDNNIPVSIDWEAAEGHEKSECKALLISLWDRKEENTLRIDLWTKDMMVGDMKRFFHQSLISMAETFKRSTSEAEMAEEMLAFGRHFGEKMELIKKTESH